MANPKALPFVPPASADAPEEAPGLSEDEVKMIASEKRITLIDQTKEWLNKQPKRRVKIRHDGDVFVQINGYSYQIQPNVPVDVPEPVAVLLEQGDYI